MWRLEAVCTSAHVVSFSSSLSSSLSHAALDALNFLSTHSDGHFFISPSTSLLRLPPPPPPVQSSSLSLSLPHSCRHGSDRHSSSAGTLAPAGSGFLFAGRIVLCLHLF